MGVCFGLVIGGGFVVGLSTVAPRVYVRLVLLECLLVLDLFGALDSGDWLLLVVLERLLVLIGCYSYSVLDVCSWLFAGLVLFTLVVCFVVCLDIVCCLWCIVLITCAFGVGCVLIVFVGGWLSADLRCLGFVWLLVWYDFTW